jgi:hypothetical protein
MGAIRPPSRHKDPPKNLGLELPPDDYQPGYIDNDSDSSFGFEVGLDNANAAKGNLINGQNKINIESGDDMAAGSFERQSSDEDNY